ncbi:MAG: penicillin-binding protein [Bacillota bacterium]|nr:penicillin-binding protein [Bacillota bacterium]
MNSYYMPQAMYRNPQDTRFFPFLPFVAGLATGGLLTIPFLYAGRPYYPPPYPMYPPYPPAYPPYGGYGGYGGMPGGGVPYPAV